MGASGQANAKAGEGPTGGTTNGGVGHAAGTAGEVGSTLGGAPGKGGASTGGSSPNSSGSGGAVVEPSSGGENPGGADAGGAGAGGAGDGGAGDGGTSASTGLLVSYACESASGAVLADSSGHGKNASLVNGNGSGGFSFGAGKVGNALTLNSSKQAYVSLPPGIVSQLTEVTIATWVNLKSGTAFQRIFDFGLDTGTFMYLVNAGSSGFVRLRITSVALNKNQILEGAEALPVGKWTHVAVTLGDNGVSIYVDGAQVAQQAPAAVRPSNLGVTANNFIGRSPFSADPYLDGQIDEFRIYDRALSLDEIGELARGD